VIGSKGKSVTLNGCSKGMKVAEVPLVRAATKVQTDEGRYKLLVVEEGALEEGEGESLISTGMLSASNCSVDVTPTTNGGSGKLGIGGSRINLKFKRGVPTFEVMRPTSGDMRNLEMIEIGAGGGGGSEADVRRVFRTHPTGIEEWKRTLGCRTLNETRAALAATTQLAVPQQGGRMTRSFVRRFP